MAVTNCRRTTPGAGSRGACLSAPTVGVSYKSAQLNDYYWGVQCGRGQPRIARIPRGRTVSDSKVDCVANYHLSRNLRIAVSVNYEELTDDVAASPLADDDYVIGLLRRTRLDILSRCPPVPIVHRVLPRRLQFGGRCRHRGGAPDRQAAAVCDRPRDHRLLDDLRHPLEERARRRVLPERQRRSAPLRCWTSALGGTHAQQREVNEAFVYWLGAPGGAQRVAEVKIEVLRLDSDGPAA